MAPKFPNMSKSEVLSLVKEVSASLQTIGAAELARLAKGEGSSSVSPSMKKDDLPPEGSVSSASSGSPSASSGSPEGSASASGLPPGDGAPPAGPEASAPPAGPEGSAPPMAGPEGSAPPAGPEGAPPAGPSFEELVSLYAALPPPDLEAHAAAMQQAMSMKQGASPAGAPPAGPPGAPPSAGPSAPPMGKQEVATATTTGPVMGLEPSHDTPAKVETANPNIPAGAKKSEEDERFAKLTKNVEDLGKVVETILTIPQRKAHTGISYIPYPMKKSEGETKPAKKPFADLTKAELHVVLKNATAPSNAKLSKAERDVITDYVLSPSSVDLAVIESIYNKV